jgi:mycoredoxin
VLAGNLRAVSDAEQVTDGAAVVEAVTVYWRPGCGFCSSLLRSLQNTELALDLHNIWDDPEAAAAVRSLANGNETVPTVRIGTAWAAVNPSGPEVLDAVRHHAPHLLSTT